MSTAVLRSPRRVSNLRLGRAHETGASWADDFRGSSSPQGTAVPLSLNILQERPPAVQACLPVCAHMVKTCVLSSAKDYNPGFAHEQTLGCPPKGPEGKVWRGWARAYCCQYEGKAAWWKTKQSHGKVLRQICKWVILCASACSFPNI